MNNEALNVLLERRAIRKFKSEQIKDKELDAVLKAGTYAPTGKGTQQPVIVAVQDKNLRDRISKLNAKIMGTDSDPYYGAPTIVIVFASKDAYDHDIAVMDCAAVTTNILNAAYAVGLGSCWINRPMAMFKTDEGKELLKDMGIEQPLTGVASVALGYADCVLPEPKPRKEGYIIKV